MEPCDIGLCALAGVVKAGMGRKSVKKLVCILAFFLLVPTLYLRAQTTNGSIQGTVTDPSGATVGGATVTGRNMDTGLAITTVTTDAGLYSLANLPPGRYTVTIEAPNLKLRARAYSR